MFLLERTKKRRWAGWIGLIAVISIALCVRAYRHEQLGHELILALKVNDTNRALAALQAHADPNFRDQEERPPDFQRYLSTFWQQIRGIKPPAKTRPTALALAVQQDNAVLVEALLAAGAKNIGETLPVLYDRNGNEFSPFSPVPLLKIAVRNGNPAIVWALARHGWNVNQTDADHRTVLFSAEDATMVKALVACGADINARDKDGHTALDANLSTVSNSAAIEKSLALLDLGANDVRAFTVAACYGHLQVLNSMLDRGWNIDTHNEEGSTPLMAALKSEDDVHPQGALFLIRRGANGNARDRRGSTPLMLAAEGGGEPDMNVKSPQIVNALLERGARVDAQDREGITPLMVATLHLRPALMRLLLQHGARVDTRSRQGETALSMALRNYYPGTRDGRHGAVVRMLRAAGARE